MKVKAPAQTPEQAAAAVAQRAEQQRADQAFITNTQDLLTDEGNKRARRFGRRQVMAGVNIGPGPAGLPGAAPAASGSAGGYYGGYAGPGVGAIQGSGFAGSLP